MKEIREKPYPLRMEPGVRPEVEYCAKRERRSINAWINLAIDERLHKTRKEGRNHE
ncbi:MAG: hypothetical protein M0Q95_17130 [Porticoccaceae bacterium]|nr:hypothetical protein [Porticoccaceae bacterium]